MAQSRINFDSKVSADEILDVKKLLYERGFFVRNDGVVLEKETDRPCYLPRQIAQEIMVIDGVINVS